MPITRIKKEVPQSGDYRSHLTKPRQILNGMTAGFSDEIGNGVAAGLYTLADKLKGKDTQFSKVYGDMQESYHDEQDAYKEQNPVEAVMLELGGALTTGGVGAAKTAGMTGAKRIAALGGIGAGYGAASGAGNAKPEDIVNDALRGGYVGAGLGILMPAIGNKVGELVTKLVSRKPTNEADRKILSAILADDKTPETVKKALQELGEGATIADAAGESVINLTRSSRGVPGKAANQAERFFQDRMKGEYTRLMDAAKSGLGAKGEFFKTTKALEEGRKLASKPLYEQAYRTNVEMTPVLQQLMKYPTMKRATSMALKKSRDDGVTLDEKIFDVKKLDYVKRSLDDIWSSTKGADAKRQIIKMKNLLLDQVDEQVPVYQEARAIWSGSKQLQDAAEDGANFLKGESDLIAEDLANMTEAQMEFFRIGALRALKNYMGKTKNTNSIAAKFDNPAMQERLKAVFPDDDAFNGFMNVIAKEERFGEVRNKILRGSQTAEKTGQNSALADVSEVGSEIARGNTGNAVRGMGRSVARAFTQPRPEVSEAIVNKTANGSLADNMLYLDNINKGSGAGRKWRKLTDAMTGTASLQMGNAN